MTGQRGQKFLSLTLVKSWLKNGMIDLSQNVTLSLRVMSRNFLREIQTKNFFDQFRKGLVTGSISYDGKVVA